MAGQNSSVESRCLNLHLKTYVPLGFNIFELEQFTLYDSSAALDLPLRQWRNGSSSLIKETKNVSCQK
jgi:hypothetical protein